LTIAYFFAQKALDRSLLDDAYALAANVSASHGSPVLNLSEREIGAVLFDQSERVFFSLLREDGSFVAGHGGLRDGAPPADVSWEFADRHTRGLDLRTVTLRRENPVNFIVVVGQTVNSRNQLLQQLVLQSLVPQVLLLILLGVGLRRSVDKELNPLSRLQREVDSRHGADLAPVQTQAASQEVQRLADAINRLLERVQAGVQAQREFTGNVAHELRTPLAGIRSLAEHGLAQKDPEQWRTQLQRVLQSEQRASHLMDQLLALALADESRDTLVLHPMAMDVWVRDFVLRHLPQADAQGIDLGASGLDEPIWAWGQTALLEGVLANLLDNAMRYGRPGSRDSGAPTPQITVSLRVRGEEVILSVNDNGPGLSAEQQERLMARGSQGLDGQALGRGAGLGLSIVQRYAELLEGRLALQSQEGLHVSLILRRAPPPRLAS
jgi:two-component system sensor histidine kinase TctE